MPETSENEKPQHVLVVDDNTELAQTYRELLEAFGYEVTTAWNGETALGCIQERPVDAILCDLSMPRLDGDAFYEEAMRLRPELGRRFVFLTGHVNNPRYEPFLKREGLRVLYKPVLVDNLLAALQAALAEPSRK